MRLLILIFILPLFSFSLAAQNTESTNSIGGSGLNSLRPPAGTSLSRSLKAQPNDQATELRQLKDSDRVNYLRTDTDWYEVDVHTAEGLDFRGWLKGSLPQERKLLEAQPIKSLEEKPTGPNPLDSKSITWFWDNKNQDRGSLRLLLGAQNLSFELSGLNSSGDRQGIAPGYDFFGLGLNFGGEFIPLQTKILGRAFQAVLRGDFEYGLHRVSFSNPFPQIPEIAGQGYEISSQMWSIEGLGRMLLKEFDRGSFEFGLGLGFLYYAISPDLSPVQGGVYDGQLVFFDNVVSALTIPVEFRFKFLDKFSIQPRFRVLLLSNYSENVANQSAKSEISGFPLLASGTFGWEINKHWSLESDLEYIKINSSDKSDTTDDRFGVQYTKGQSSFNSLRMLAGLRWKF